jgi:tetratricopeptide (TPR) repeat protein
MCARPTIFAFALSAAVVAAPISAATFSKDAFAEDDRTAANAAALALFEDSEARYREGRFREAAELLERAYALDPAPILLFNLARALESAGDLSNAVEAYARYVGADPEAKDRRAVEKRIENLRAQIAEKTELERQRDEEAQKRAELERRASLAVRERPSEAPKATGPGPVPWIVAGSGVAVVAAGGVLGALALSRHQAAESEPVNAKASDLLSSSRRFETAANIAYAIGGAALAGGLLWVLFGHGGAPASDPSATGDGASTFALRF